MVVGEDGEGVVRDRGERQAGRRQAPGEQRARPEVRIRQRHLAAVLEGEGGLPDPGQRASSGRAPSRTPSWGATDTRSGRRLAAA